MCVDPCADTHREGAQSLQTMGEIVPDDPIAEEYRGHRIELRVEDSAEEMGEARGEATQVLLIDGVPTGYGQLPDGSYALDDYAYDWRDNLVDVAKGFIDYRLAAEESTGGSEQSRDE